MSEEQVTIPGANETIMHGIVQQMAPRVLQCGKGGFIVLFEGIGVAARSEWHEVVTCIEDIGYDHMNLPRPTPHMPKGIDPTTRDENVHPPAEGGFRLHSIAALIATIGVLLSVKIA